MRDAAASRPAGAATRTRVRARFSPANLLLAAQVGALLAMVLTVTNRLWVDHEWFGFALAALTVAVWSPEFTRRRARFWMFLYVTGTFVYTLLRAYADETAIPVRTEYVIDFERTLFLGEVPVVWLQDRFFEPPDVGLLEWAAVATHWSFFVAPHALALYLFAFRRDLFPRYAALVLAVLYLALALFFVVPTTPPWLAGVTGALPLDGSYRILDFAGRSLDPGAYDSLYKSLGEPNSVAAMPSLHLGLTFAMYLFVRRHLPALQLVTFVYSLLMGLALVYLAEHYVLDLLVGAACALVASAALERIMIVRTAVALAEPGAPRIPDLAEPPAR